MKSLYKSPCPWKKLQQSRLWAISSTFFFNFLLFLFFNFHFMGNVELHKSHFLSAIKHCFEFLKKIFRWSYPRLFIFWPVGEVNALMVRAKNLEEPFEKWTPDWLSLYLVFFGTIFLKNDRNSSTKLFTNLFSRLFW